MKRVILFAGVLFALALSSFSTDSAAGVSSSNLKERGVMTFTEPVQLLNVTLKGEYLFVHDDRAMARGEACTYVYKGPVEDSHNLVISFHCLPQPRTKVGKFVVRSRQLPSGVDEIREIQFAGATEGHRVPKTTE